MRNKTRTRLRRFVAFMLSFAVIFSGFEYTQTRADTTTATSKKGMQLDNPSCMWQAVELGCSSVFINIRVTDFMSLTDDYDLSESFTVSGVTYYMNAAMLNHYKEMLEFGRENGIEQMYLQIYAEEFAGLTDTTESSAYFHAFDMTNCADVVANVFELVCEYMGEYVDYWIMGNEVNNSHVYYETGTDDLSTFVANYEAAMRLMYDTAVVYNPDACVMACLDHEWTSTEGGRFSSMDILTELAAITADDDYNWGVAIHPYPEPLISAAFWDDYLGGATDEENALRITMYNLHIFTTFMQGSSMLYDGDVRHIAITEIGFNAENDGEEDEELQAAAFAYAYYIAEANEYIDAFEMRSYQDNETESALGLKFGLFDLDGNQREIYNVFKYIDTIYGSEFTDAYLSYFGVSSWSELIDGFDDVSFTKDTGKVPVVDETTEEESITEVTTTTEVLSSTVTHADDLTPEATNNAGDQSYTIYYASPMNSYLVSVDEGFMRVEYNGSDVVVEYYDSDYTLTDKMYVTAELSLFGGFYAGEDAYYLVFGQTNLNEDDSVEVYRVVKYSTDWERLGQASLYGANTYIPFDAGSCRMTEYNGYLYIRTCHEMYAGSDGLHHQANVSIAVEESEMEVVSANYG